jgi:hypothetical protein
MAYEVSSRLDEIKLAESEAFRRLVDLEDLGNWDETFGAWLRAMRKLQRASAGGPRSTGEAAALVPGLGDEFAT